MNGKPTGSGRDERVAATPSLRDYPEFFWRGRDSGHAGLRAYLSDEAVIAHILPAWRSSTQASGRLGLAATVVEDLLNDKWRLIDAVNLLTDTRWHRLRRRFGFPVRLGIPHYPHVRLDGSLARKDAA